MVDSIKGGVTSASAQSSGTPAAQAETRRSQSSLRTSFQSLSSGTSVSETAREASAVVSVERRGGLSQTSKLASNLNDAVRFSNEALRALEDVAQAAEGVGVPGVVQEFAEDLDKLKSDIANLLQSLRERADRASLIDENVEASGARIEDVERAQETAQSLSFSVEEALSAHGNGLTADRVAELLAE